MAFAENRAEARDTARAAWDLWREPSRSHPPVEPRRVVGDSPWPTEEDRAGQRVDREVREAFDAQPLVTAYREAVAALLEAHRGYDLGGFLHGGAAAETVGRTGREEFAATVSAGNPWRWHGSPGGAARRHAPGRAPLPRPTRIWATAPEVVGFAVTSGHNCWRNSYGAGRGHHGADHRG